MQKIIGSKSLQERRANHEPEKAFFDHALSSRAGAAVLFSVAYIAEEVNHECTGAGCAVCQQISVCESLLKAVGGAALAAGAAAMVFSKQHGAALPCAECVQTNTLISLKVKLSD